MKILDNLERSVADQKMMSMGYDRAAKAGKEGAYMRMMNRGASGGYTERQIAEAEARDAKRRNK
jgi:hypothetical protein